MAAHPLALTILNRTVFFISAPLVTAGNKPELIENKI
jgi:hypothetical protein